MWAVVKWLAVFLVFNAVFPRNVKASPVPPPSRAHCGCAAQPRCWKVCITPYLPKISHDNVASPRRRATSGVPLVTKQGAPGRQWPSQSLLVATELPNLCGLGVSLYQRRVELPPLDTAYWPSCHQQWENPGETVRHDAPSLKEKRDTFARLRWIYRTNAAATMSDQNYYWTVLPSYKTSFVPGGMMKRTKG